VTYWSEFPCAKLDDKRVTIDELVALLKQDHVLDISASQLRRWEANYYIPLPRKAGVPMRSMYPAWAADVIAQIETARVGGASWEETREIYKHDRPKRLEQMLIHVTMPDHITVTIRCDQVIITTDTVAGELALRCIAKDAKELIEWASPDRHNPEPAS
jgi:DNA-binding transcriptional MerR regulator